MLTIQILGGQPVLQMKLFLTLVCILFLGLAVFLDYLPGRQTYWDHRISELCADDGGLTTYSQVHVSRADIDADVLPRVWPSGVGPQGLIQVVVEDLADGDPVFIADERRTNLHDWNPEVWRVEQPILRRSDRSAVAHYVYYYRIGGDFPTFISHPSSFICPSAENRFIALNSLFIVE